MDHDTDSLKIYSVSDRYVEYLRSDPVLARIFDNKEETRRHTRKYIGVVLIQNGFCYFAPFSSPKNSDYSIPENGKRQIRRSIIPIIRMTAKDNVRGQLKLKGTLKLSSMISVPDADLVLYDMDAEEDTGYKGLITNQWLFIRVNAELIKKNATTLYNQKTKENELFKPPANKPGYLASTVDFLYAEKKCSEFVSANSLR
jgi:protein AbiQ